MSFKIVAISDIHYGDSCKLPRRKSEYGRILLRRTIERINELDKPDAVAMLGDCLDNPKAPDALEKLAELKEDLDLLRCPYIVIPGNHDPEPSLFYQVMTAPPDVVDIGPVRFLPFVDAERPGYNAERLPADLARMRAARQSHAGPVITLQHVPVLPPGQTECHYGYTNIDEILDIMAEQAVTLSISGHEHKGTPTVFSRGCAFVTVSALCEEPFHYTIITLNDTEVQVNPQAHQLPSGLRLIDTHIHTQFAYCSKGIEMAKSIEVAKLLGLDGVVFSEHSGQLYFERKMYWQAAFCAEGIDDNRRDDSRMKEYLSTAAQLAAPSSYVGLEIDCDYNGRPVVMPADKESAVFCNGAIHFLPELRRVPQAPPDPLRLADEFLHALQAFIGCGIDALAHPFRIFQRAHVPTPEFLFSPVVKMLREHNVAAEINFHTNHPETSFFRECIDAGVKLTLGSDAHIQCAVGDFAAHLQFLRECGYDGDLSDILLTPKRKPVAPAV